MAEAIEKTKDVQACYKALGLIKVAVWILFVIFIVLPSCRQVCSIIQSCCPVRKNNTVFLKRRKRTGTAEWIITANHLRTYVWKLEMSQSIAAYINGRVSAKIKPIKIWSFLRWSLVLQHCSLYWQLGCTLCKCELRLLCVVTPQPEAFLWGEQHSWTTKDTFKNDKHNVFFFNMIKQHLQNTTILKRMLKSMKASSPHSRSQESTGGREVFKHLFRARCSSLSNQDVAHLGRAIKDRRGEGTNCTNTYSWNSLNVIDCSDTWPCKI